MSGAGGAAERGDDAPMPHGVMDLLLELASGVHRFAMYPEGHPALASIAETVHRRASAVLLERTHLTIGVAHHSLVVDDEATDADHPVVGDLARRLHGHQLGALELLSGVAPDEVEALIRCLSLDVERGDSPLGLRDEESRPAWEHVRLYPTGYDRLRIRGDEGGAAGPDEELHPGRAADLWIGLSRLARLGGGGDGGSDPKALARFIEAARGDAELEEELVGTLVRLTEALQSEPHSETAAVRDRVSALIEALDPETLQHLLDMGGDVGRRHQFVMDASQSLAVDSVVRVLESAARATGQTISTLLLRLLRKLSAHASAGSGRARVEARSALQENVRQLIQNWQLEDPNPDRYTRVLDGMAGAAPTLHAASGGEELAGALRVLQMALEVDAFGATVASAIEDLYEQRRIAVLLDLLEEADPGNAAARGIDSFLADPDRFARLVREGALDGPTLERLVDRLGRAAADTLVGLLVEADSEELHGSVFDQLAGMPEVVHEALPALLADDRAFVRCNLLRLVQRMDAWPAGFDPEASLDHSDARVRREALVLAVGDPDFRARALLRGIADKDDDVAHTALQAASEDLSPALVPTILNRVVRSDRPSEIRVAGIEALEGLPMPMARDGLLEVCLTRRGFLGRRLLGPTTPELLAALRVLSSTWGRDARARRVLGRARRSHDEDVRRAANDGRDEP